MTEDTPADETPTERKRRLNREYIAAKRAALTPEDRAARRKAYDAAYRASHRAERQEYDKARNARLREESA